MSAGFTLHLRNDLTQVPRLIDRLAAFGREHALPDRVIGNVALAVDELVSNVISHALPPDGTHLIEADITIEGDRLVVKITDGGPPFNPFDEAPQPDLESVLEDRRIGGLGIFLVKQLMDEATYRREGITNFTVIAKKIRELATTGS